MDMPKAHSFLVPIVCLFMNHDSNENFRIWVSGFFSLTLILDALRVIHNTCLGGGLHFDFTVSSIITWYL